MTAFLPEYIPPQIQSIEQLIVWCGEILQNQYPDKTVVYAVNEQTLEDILIRSVEASKFYYTAASPAEWRYTCKFEIKLSSNHQIYGRLWDHARPIGDAEIPLQMRRIVA